MSLNETNISPMCWFWMKLGKMYSKERLKRASHLLKAVKAETCRSFSRFAAFQGFLLTFCTHFSSLPSHFQAYCHVSACVCLSVCLHLCLWPSSCGIVTKCWLHTWQTPLPACLAFWGFQALRIPPWGFFSPSSVSVLSFSAPPPFFFLLLPLPGSAGLESLCFLSELLTFFWNRRSSDGEALRLFFLPR